MQQITVWREKITFWFYNFLLVQLFINLLTWPLMLGWGLPITPLSIVGNLVFSPFLTVFLILSSLIVTFQLLSLSDWLFTYLLEQLTHGWLWLTACSTPDCLVAFITPPLVLALCAPLAATWIICSKKLPATRNKVHALIAAYILFIGLFSLLPAPQQCEVAYGSNIIKVLHRNGKLFMVDPGFSRRKSGITTWINYSLLPALGAAFGRQKVDYVILKKNSPSAQACAQALKERNIAKKIITSQDERVKTTPSSRAAPLTLSKSP